MNIPAHYLSNAPASPILNLSSNADGDLFASAETDGWRIWDAETLDLVASHDSPNGSLSIVLPLHRTNLLFLVGGPPSPLYAPNKVIVYSLIKRAPIAALEFRSKVLGICARRDRLIVKLHRRVVLFGIQIESQTVYREGAYDTVDNPRGLCAVATDFGSTLLCFPGRQHGQVVLVHLNPLQQIGKGKGKSLASDHARNPPFPSSSILLAHSSALSALAVNPSGSLIATSSVKGTLIRIFDAKTATLVKELRRGTDTAEIFSLSLRADGRALACASDKGTIHIWDLTKAPASSTSDTPSSILSQAEGLKLLKPYLPKYFSSSWSDAQFKLPPPEIQAAPSLPFLDALADEKMEKPKTVEEDKVLLTWIKTIKGEKEQQLLIVATHSGSWYSLACLEDSGEDKEAAESERTADGFGVSGQCRVIEHRKFDQVEDW